MAATTTTVTVLAIAAAATAAAGAVAQGAAASRAAKFKAAVQRQQAERERQQAAADEEDFRRKQSRLLATRRAGQGASGVEVGEGSPLLTEEDFVGEGELEALRIRNGGEVRATRLEQGANQTSSAGRAALTGGIIRGGSLLLQGASRASTIESSRSKLKSGT